MATLFVVLPQGLKVINHLPTDSVIKIMHKHTPTIDEATLRQPLPDEGHILVKSSRAPGHCSGQPVALSEMLPANSFSVGDSAEDARL